MFSYARNSCYQNHSRYTLCAYHYNEGHDGSWQHCQECRASFETEMYVYYVTNEYNFEKLSDPPAYKPTRCAGCGEIIRLGEGGYSMSAGKYLCLSCTNEKLARDLRRKTS
jgi:formylmethanofuran dehydrogenase subunit E